MPAAAYAADPQSFAGLVMAAGLATVALSIVLEGSQGLRLSRLSLPFLVGTMVTGNRNRAMVVGFVLTLAGGMAFAGLYLLAFRITGIATWWWGAILGMIHALFLLSVALPILPYLHPRLASEHDGPTGRHTIEPPGFLALNYGRGTPVVTVLAHAIYGAIL